MIDNSSRFALKNSSVFNQLTQSQLPMQTYALKLQNNKPVKLFIKIKNESVSTHQTFIKTISFVQKLKQVFFKYKRDVFEDWKEMLDEVEEYNCHGPSLLEQMMRSQIPIRNGSFMNAGMAFSVIKSNTQLNRSRDSRCDNIRASISSRTLSGFLKLLMVIQSKNKQQQRLFFDTSRQVFKENISELMSKVINKIASNSFLNLQTSLLRLKNISSKRPSQTKQIIQQNQTNKKNAVQQISTNQSVGVPQIKLIKSIVSKQQRKRIQCFITILQNIDKLKTFGIISEAFTFIKTS